MPVVRGVAGPLVAVLVGMGGSDHSDGNIDGALVKTGERCDLCGVGARFQALINGNAILAEVSGAKTQRNILGSAIGQGSTDIVSVHELDLLPSISELGLDQLHLAKLNLAVALTQTADRALAVHKGVAIKACLLFQAGEVAGFPVLASAIVIEHVGIPALRPDVGMGGRIGERDLDGTADGLVPRRSSDGGCAIGDSGNSAVSGDGGNKGVAGEPSDLFLWVADGGGQFLLFFRLGQGQLRLIQGEGQFRNLHGDLAGGLKIAILGGGGDICRAVAYSRDQAAFVHGGNFFVAGFPGDGFVGGAVRINGCSQLQRFASLGKGLSIMV